MIQVDVEHRCIRFRVSGRPCSRVRGNAIGERDQLFRPKWPTHGGERGAQLLSQRIRKDHLLIDDYAAQVKILQKRRPGLADGRGLQARSLRSFKQGGAQQQTASQVGIEAAQYAEVFGEYHLAVEVHRLSGRILPVGSRLKDVVPVVSVVSRKVARCQSGSVHHGESRIDRMMICELAALLTEGIQVWSVGASDCIGSQSIPDEDDHPSAFGTSCLRMRRCMTAGNADQQR